ncbi:HU family DNA-binding protein [Candidatus Thioglobus sp.]|jgi:DNA-binding protein HU-beta|uniref:HU family DNA-binding protein n=1 Tax=Candidatus Thioglobus sp. TaxID=2026721 RepID=UPI0025C548DD|nr:HU family DNA-binding protein [Candidatus Thioglobus sp.]
MLGTNSTIIKGQPMNKSELIDAIASESGLSKADATRALNATTDAITGALSKEDTVQLTGFGSFVVRARAARSGRNPQTGATIQIKASKVAAFKAGKALKDTVNK